MQKTQNIQESTKRTLKSGSARFTYFHLGSLKKIGIKSQHKLPYSIKVLLESVLRNCDGYKITKEDIQKIASWSPRMTQATEIAFNPGRVILQDFTGVPCVVDLAAMRSAMKDLNGDHRKINPLVP